MPPPVKLKVFVVRFSEVQAYLDQYQEKIKFIFQDNNQTGNSPDRSFTLIIDVS